jgi:hypothetical protein
MARLASDRPRCSLLMSSRGIHPPGAGGFPGPGLFLRGLRSRSKPASHSHSTASPRCCTTPAYIGKVTYQGVEHDGTHKPLIHDDTLYAVQQLLASRTVRGAGERKHNHHLKGLLHCAVCDHPISIDTAKAQRYRYFFCTGQKRQRKRAPTGCREPYAPTDRVEVELDRIYQRVQLPADLVARIEDELQAEIATRQRRTVEERDRHTSRLAALWVLGPIPPKASASRDAPPQVAI